MPDFRSRIARRVRERVTPPEQRLGMHICLRSISERGFRPNTIFDVGAASGDWARLARSVWPSADLVMFEPLPLGDRAESLRELTQGEPPARLIEAGVGREAGSLPISVGEDLAASSFAYIAGDATREVPIVALDDLVTPAGDLAQPDLLKLDVQGYELEILAGGERVLAAAEVVILEARLFGSELPLVVEVLDYMRDRDFELLEIADVLRRPLDGAMVECDLVFAQAGTPLVSLGGWNEPLPAPPFRRRQG